MSKSKSVIVTAALTAMTLLIMAGLLALNFTKAFIVIAGVFAAFGMSGVVCRVYGWLREEREVEPSVPEVFADTVESEEKTLSFEDIMEEMRGNG